MLKPTNAATPQEYIDLIAEPRKSQIQTLHHFIQEIVPHLKTQIQAGMIGYGQYHYKYASGREGDSPIIALASQKNYISVYVCASDGSQYIAEKYKEQLPKANIGRSCIRFKKIENIDLNVLKKIILEGVEVLTK